MTFSQRKTVLALPRCSLSVTHLEHWSKQTRPPSSERAIDRAPPVKPFVKSSASPLPLSPSLPLPIGPIHMESCERLKIFKVILMCMSLPSSLEPGMTSVVPLLSIRCIRQKKEVGNRYLKFQLQRRIVACFKKFPPPCIIHDNINAAIYPAQDSGPLSYPVQQPSSGE